METRTIELSLEDAINLYKLGGNYRNIALRVYTEAELIGLPKTWEEFCRMNRKVEEEWVIAANSQLYWTNESSRDPETNANLLVTRHDAEAHLALIKLHRLRDCYRSSWTPNWNSIDAKAVIIIEDGVPRVAASIYVSHFLSFQSQEIAREFRDNFKKLIETAKELI